MVIDVNQTELGRKKMVAIGMNSGFTFMLSLVRLTYSTGPIHEIPQVLLIMCTTPVGLNQLRTMMIATGSAGCRQSMIVGVKKKVDATRTYLSANR